MTLNGINIGTERWLRNSKADINNVTYRYHISIDIYELNGMDVSKLGASNKRKIESRLSKLTFCVYTNVVKYNFLITEN